MKVQIIKREIPAEISETGGAFVTIVNKETVDLETSVDEAKDALIVVGDKLLIKGMFVGLFKSMVKGIERDGNARQLGDFLTLYPVPTGEFDLDKGWDPAVNGVRIRARLMNEMEIDISKWEFEDVTEGRQPFRLESVKAGAVTGVIQLGQPVEVNGTNLPLTDAVSVDWAVRDTAQAGTVASAKVTSTVSRLDMTADALDAIKTAANDGKTLDLTVRGNYANAKIAATLKYVPPVLPTVTHVQDFAAKESFTITGTNIKFQTGVAPWTAEKLDGTPVTTTGSVTSVAEDGKSAVLYMEDFSGELGEYVLKFNLVDSEGSPCVVAAHGTFF